MYLYVLGESFNVLLIKDFTPKLPGRFLDPHSDDYADFLTGKSPAGTGGNKKTFSKAHHFLCS